MQVHILQEPKMSGPFLGSPFDDDFYPEDGPPAYQYHEESTEQSTSMRIRPLPVMPPMPSRPPSSASIVHSHIMDRDDSRTEIDVGNDDARTEVSISRGNTVTSGIGSVRSGASSHRRRDRNVFYNIFEDHTRVLVKAPFDPADPYTGHLNSLHLHPPRTIQVLKRFIANKESIESRHIAGIYLTPDDDDPAEDSMKIMRLDGEPGSTMDNPITIIVDRQVIGEPLLMEPPLGTTNTHSLWARWTDHSAKSWRNRVASPDRPMGWAIANTITPCYLNTLKVSKSGNNQSWGPSVGEKIQIGTLVYVDPRVFTWNGQPCYRVINPAAMTIGYCKKLSIRINESKFAVKT